MSVTVPFPDRSPPGYDWFDDEPVFDPVRHLELERPAAVVGLAELGYGPDEIAGKATDFAVSEPFRVLSDEGAAVLLDVCRRLESFHRPAGDRIERVVRGGCYRSRFLRDLCISPELTAHMAEIFGVDIAPHPMPLHLGHLNFEPTDVSSTVDKWHHDTLPLDFVLMVTDPADMSGGEFEWFRGTKAEAAALAGRGSTPPRDRVEQPHFPGAGYAVALHGDMVVHRAAGLREPGRRTTMVNGYVATDTSTQEQSRSADLIGVDDPAALWTEWAKFAAWRSASRLHSLIGRLEFGIDAETAAAELERAIEAAQTAAEQMRAGAPATVDHYE